MTPSYHHGDLKPALLTYAREQLEQGNLDALSMREMAKTIGVSHTAAYRHFTNKHALLDAVAVQGFEEMLEACAVAVRHEEDVPRSMLKACGLAYIRFGMTYPRLLAHMFSAASMPQASAALGEAGARLFDMLLGLVSDGQSRGAFRNGDTRQLAHACWAMVHGLSALLSIGAIKKSSSANADASLSSAQLALDTFLNGLAASCEPPTASGHDDGAAT